MVHQSNVAGIQLSGSGSGASHSIRIAVGPSSESLDTSGTSESLDTSGSSTASADSDYLESEPSASTGFSPRVSDSDINDNPSASSHPSLTHDSNDVVVVDSVAVEDHVGNSHSPSSKSRRASSSSSLHKNYNSDGDALSDMKSLFGPKHMQLVNDNLEEVENSGNGIQYDPQLSVHSPQAGLNPKFNSVEALPHLQHDPSFIQGHILGLVALIVHATAFLYLKGAKFDRLMAFPRRLRRASLATHPFFLQGPSGVAQDRFRESVNNGDDSGGNGSGHGARNVGNGANSNPSVNADIAALPNAGAEDVNEALVEDQQQETVDGNLVPAATTAPPTTPPLATAASGSLSAREAAGYWQEDGDLWEVEETETVEVASAVAQFHFAIGVFVGCCLSLVFLEYLLPGGGMQEHHKDLLGGGVAFGIDSSEYGRNRGGNANGDHNSVHSARTDPLDFNRSATKVPGIDTDAIDSKPFDSIVSLTGKPVLRDAIHDLENGPLTMTDYVSKSYEKVVRGHKSHSGRAHIINKRSGYSHDDSESLSNRSSDDSDGESSLNSDSDTENAFLDNPSLTMKNPLKKWYSLAQKSFGLSTSFGLSSENLSYSSIKQKLVGYFSEMRRRALMKRRLEEEIAMEEKSELRPRRGRSGDSGPMVLSPDSDTTSDSISNVVPKSDAMSDYGHGLGDDNHNANSYGLSGTDSKSPTIDPVNPQTSPPPPSYAQLLLLIFTNTLGIAAGMLAFLYMFCCYAASRIIGMPTAGAISSITAICVCTGCGELLFANHVHSLNMAHCSLTLLITAIAGLSFFQELIRYIAIAEERSPLLHSLVLDPYWEEADTLSRVAGTVVAGLSGICGGLLLVPFQLTAFGPIDGVLQTDPRMGSEFFAHMFLLFPAFGLAFLLCAGAYVLSWFPQQNLKFSVMPDVMEAVCIGVGGFVWFVSLALTLFSAAHCNYTVALIFFHSYVAVYTLWSIYIFLEVKGKWARGSYYSLMLMVVVALAVICRNQTG